MKKLLVIAALFIGAGTVSCVRVDREASPVRGAWARAADSAATTAAYFTYVNRDTVTVEITSWSSPDAASVELHQTMVMDGMAHMLPTTALPVIEPGDSLVLTPGAQHLMVIGLKRRVAAGDSVTLVIATSRGRSLRFGAQVRAP